MDPGTTLRAARGNASLTQEELAVRSGTSQATISAYESGAKQPTVATFSRLLAATGSRLAVKRMRRAVIEPSPVRLAHSGRVLGEVLALAEALPARRHTGLRYPRLRRRGERA